MKKLILLLVAACTSLQSAAPNTLDSLLAVWNDESLEDTTRLDAVQKIAWDIYVFSEPDSAFYFSQLQYDFAKSKDLKKEMARALNVQAVSFAIRGAYSKALDYYQKSLAIHEELANKRGIAIANNNIGHVYQSQNNHLKALEHYQKSLALNKELENKHGIANSHGSMGLVYAKQGEYQKALEAYKISLEIKHQLGNKLEEANCLGNMGIIYAEQGDLSKALESYKRSLSICEELGSQADVANWLTNIGISYQLQKDNSKALEYCEKGYQTALSMGLLEHQESACECLYNTYRAMGKDGEALFYLEKLQAVRDSLNSEETGQKLQQMEFEKTMLQDSISNAEEDRLVEEAHQEEVRQKKRTRNIFGGVGFFALLLAGGFYWRWRYVRKSKAALQVEKDRSENLLLNILPEEIAEELKEKGRADARDFEMVSILFTDFKGFTAASEKLSAQDLVSEINTCFETFDGIMGKYNIEKIKTIGDAYMAAGGLPVPTDESVKSTVLAALEMQDFIRERKAKLDAEGKPGFEMRVGVHTGPVVAGIVGVKKFQYDIWGDTVNTASRMESSGEVGKVNISQATYELLKDDSQFSFESRGKIEAKGKGEMEMYFVESVNS